MFIGMCPLLPRADCLFNGATYRRIAARYRTLCLRFRQQLEQGRSARIHRVKAMTETRNDLFAVLAAPFDDEGRGTNEIAIPPRFGVDLAIKLHALLAGATMDIVEHVDR
jgi:hypothetical protein